MTNITKT